MGLEKINNFAELAIDRLLQQDKERKSSQKLVTAFVSEIQNIEDSMFDVYSYRGIYTAIGAQLDIVGKIVGETRNGKNDTSYRIAILARIKLNVSAGEPNSIIDAIKQLMSPTMISFTEPYPAFFTVFIQSSINIPNIAAIIKEISPAGVGSSVITFPSGLIPFILAEVVGLPGDFGVQATSPSGLLDDLEIEYAVGDPYLLDVSSMGVIEFIEGGGLAEVYLTTSTLTVDDAGTLYDFALDDSSLLEIKLINANEDYTISTFGGRLSEVRI